MNKHLKISALLLADVGCLMCTCVRANLLSYAKSYNILTSWGGGMCPCAPMVVVMYSGHAIVRQRLLSNTYCGMPSHKRATTTDLDYM